MTKLEGAAVVRPEKSVAVSARTGKKRILRPKQEPGTGRMFIDEEVCSLGMSEM